VPDVRVDILTGDRVIVAPGRAARPDTFRAPDAPPLPPSVESCPFCPGNEHQTPPEVARTGTGDRDTPGWRIRVVPNLYPIVPGAHEVVVFSPAHDMPFARLDDGTATELFTVLRDRVAHHLAAGCAQVQVFVNHGRPAGASIEHPHAQLIGLDEVPPRIASLRGQLGEAVDEVRRTPLLLAGGDVATWCPPASIVPFAMRVGAPAGSARFERSNEAELRAIAVALRDALAALNGALGDVAYNVVVRNGPQWWIDILPRLTVQAGFELGTGLFVNSMRPDDAAAALRAAW
jgi:UDPglucose--hexose-1-phosphate uridylyltransferase